MRTDWILLLYNRADHTEQVLESLETNCIDRIFVYIDYPADQQTAQKQKVIKRILDQKWSFQIIQQWRSERFGLARSVCSSINLAFANGADSIVLLEDDCILEANGKYFFEDGLKALRNKPNIRSLCGYTNPNCPFIFDHNNDLLQLQRFSTWGWATWADRWIDYTRYRNLGELLRVSKTKVSTIEEWTPDLAKLCANQAYLDGDVDIWSIQWTLLHFLTNSFAVFPIESVINNIGLDGSGANCESTAEFSGNTHLERRRIAYKWSHLDYYFENEDIIRSFMKLHGLKTFPKLKT